MIERRRGRYEKSRSKKLIRGWREPKNIEDSFNGRREEEGHRKGVQIKGEREEEEMEG